MQAKQAVVRFRVIDGTWETCSTDRARSIWVENLILDWDTWGPKSATFDLKRDPRVPWPDLRAYTDVEIDVSGSQVWKGRIQSTPARSGSDPAISVQCEGMQAHLDDDVLMPGYVHSDITAWRDGRSFPTAGVGTWQVGGQVETGSGRIMLSWAQGMVVGTDNFTGVVLDLGPDPALRASSISVDLSVPSTANFTTQGYFFIRTEDDIGTPNVYSDAYSGNLGFTAGLGTISGDFTSFQRYVLLFLYNGTGTTTTATGNVQLCITGIRLFMKTAYRSGSTSVLTADTIINDALNRGTSLLSTDRTGLLATTFNIPQFFSQDQKTPREVISAANAYHNYVTEVDERGRFIFAPKPSAPLIEVGEHTALEAEDSSANSGEDIFNRVLVTGTTSAGDIQVVERTAAAQVGVPPVVSALQPGNPSFEVDTSGWSVVIPPFTSGAGTITRTTTAGEFDSGVAGAKVVTTTNPIRITNTVTGPFLAHRTYMLQFRTKSTVGTVGPQAYFGDPNSNDGVIQAWGASSFTTISLTWTPKADRATAIIAIDNFASASSPHFIDSFVIYEFKPTLVDRRGFLKTKVLAMSSVLDSAGLVGAQLGDTYLASHKTAQFKGSATVTGPTAREILTGKPVQPEQLGLACNGLLRFNDRIDPDTGDMGRDGRIAAVTYTLADDKAKVTIDNTSQNFEALLSRLSVISGGSA